jgi:hypothetical protein
MKKKQLLFNECHHTHTSTDSSVVPMDRSSTNTASMEAAKQSLFEQVLRDKKAIDIEELRILAEEEIAAHREMSRLRIKEFHMQKVLEIKPIADRVQLPKPR